MHIDKKHKWNKVLIDFFILILQIFLIFILSTTTNDYSFVVCYTIRLGQRHDTYGMPTSVRKILHVVMHIAVRCHHIFFFHLSAVTQKFKQIKTGINYKISYFSLFYSTVFFVISLYSFELSIHEHYELFKALKLSSKSTIYLIRFD